MAIGVAASVFDAPNLEFPILNIKSIAAKSIAQAGVILKKQKNTYTASSDEVDPVGWLTPNLLYPRPTSSEKICYLGGGAVVEFFRPS